MGCWSLGGKETSSHCLGRACGNDIALEEKLLHSTPSQMAMPQHRLDDLHGSSEKHRESDKKWRAHGDGN